MNESFSQCRFESEHGIPLVLRGLRVRGTVDNDLAVVECEQVYRNDESTNIEATYTFPLPVGCALLDMTVDLNGQFLYGQVAPRVEAEQAYEGAMADGNSSVLLSELSDGLYEMNVGNLLPGDEARISVRYAMTLNWAHGGLRLALPTTVADRYGDPAKAGLKPYELPVTDPLVENAYDLELRILDELALLPIQSPSHPISVTRVHSEAVVRIDAPAALADRDFVLVLTSAVTPISTLVLEPTSEGTLAHAAFRLPQANAVNSIVLKVLVDCSGSMNGDSMVLAKACAAHALSILQDRDCFSVSAFGSHVVHDPQGQSQGRGQMQSGGRHSATFKALNFVHALQADLGGTELEQALESAYALRMDDDDAQTSRGDVLLITDGEVWNHQPIMAAARRSRHRLFVIGIGSCPNVELVRDIAQATGGAAVYLGPNEDISIAVERLVTRMRQPRVLRAKIDLPGTVKWRTPERVKAAVTFEQTVHVFAMLEGAEHRDLESKASLVVEYDDGSVQRLGARQYISLKPGRNVSDLKRVAASKWLREHLLHEPNPNEQTLTAWAVDHQLLSPYTRYFLVAKREAAAASLPVLRTVAQMPAAGAGGRGAIFMHCVPQTWDIQIHEALKPMSSIGRYSATMSVSVDDTGVGQVLPMPGNDLSLETSPGDLTPEEFVGAVGQRLRTAQFGGAESDFPMTFRGLMDIGLPKVFAKRLAELESLGFEEIAIVCAFWHGLLKAPAGALFERPFLRIIMRAIASGAADPELRALVDRAMALISARQWHWESALVEVGDK